MIKTIRRKLLQIAYPFNQWLGRQHLPYTQKKTWQLTVGELASYGLNLTPGRVLLSQTRGSLTNLIIWSDWTHTAIVGPDGDIIEAIGEGVVKSNPYTFLLSKDRVCILEPDWHGMTIEGMGRAAQWAYAQTGAPYDYWLEPGIDAFSCSELVGQSYLRTGDSPFIPQDRLGVPTFAPQDFYDSSKFIKVWDSK